MSIQKSNKKRSVTYDGFGGIDHTQAHSAKNLAKDMVNFRILPDGSLEKRCGYRLLSSLDYDIRSFLFTVEDGVGKMYVISDNKLLLIDPVSGEQTLLATLGTSSGNAHLFTYRGKLCMVDGETMYRYSNGALTEVRGYVPLIGNPWPNNQPAATYESRNILTKRARIRYVVSDKVSVYLPTKDPVESVEAVYLNGQLIGAGEYSIDEEFNTVNVNGLAAGDEVEVYFTYKDHLTEQRQRLFSSMSSVNFRSNDGSHLFLGGGNDSGYVFGSSYVNEDSLYDSQRKYPDSDDFYFPSDHEFEVGGGLNDVRALISHREMLLIFTAADVWMSSPDSAGKVEFPATIVSGETGCSGEGCVIGIDNHTASLGTRSVWIWTNDTSSPNNCKAERISAEIDDELSLVGLENCGIFYDGTRRELWVYSRFSDLAWIYNTEMKCWYKFDGIGADHMLSANGRVCFIRGRYIFAFDENLNTDGDEYMDTFNINASYTAVLNDFGTEDRKNLASLVLKGDLYGSPVKLEFEGDGEQVKSFTLSDGKNAEHSVIKRRVSSGRFRNAVFRIEASAPTRQRIHSLTVITR